ncbi:MarR family transcriptional regulator [Alkalihalobacillus deserti]|uniref:MarR family transcriptional regulator n=1 Tax=Alkalihalobacillus deserti TaxID=2879466 RepID=UPI001D13E1C9|nr:MarR family transcriptional regulator [Alkalihalobacillus deserti]
MSLLRERFTEGYLVYAFIRGLNFAIESDVRKNVQNEKVTLPGFRILWILYFHSTIKMTDLTNLAQANISNVFRQLNKLKEEELVVIENGQDARTKKITLTKEGRKIVQNFIDENTSNSELQFIQLIEKIPKEDLTKLIEVSKLLSTELIGQHFTDFVMKSSTDLLNQSK